MAMNDRLDPCALSWPITADTILRAERAFHELDGDEWIIEELVEIKTGEWAWQPIDIDRELRLTVYRREA